MTYGLGNQDRLWNRMACLGLSLHCPVRETCICSTINTYKGHTIRTIHDIIFSRIADMIIYFLLRVRTLIIRDLLKSSPLLVADLVTTL